jgi:hypothetical protein
VYRLDPDVVVSRFVDGEVLALDLRHARYLSVNTSAAELWPLLERGASFEELRAGLTNRWNLSDDEANADLLRLLTSLDQAGLLARGDETAPPGATDAQVD